MFSRSVVKLLTLAAAASVFALQAADALVDIDWATCTINTGNQQAGIQMFTDPTCNTPSVSNQGKGCVANSNCRYCRVWDTMQSVNFPTCTALGHPFSGPTPAPTAAPTTCTTSATTDERSFGINLVTDVSCTNGGLGCKNTICRYCKDVDTPKSTQFYNCTNVLNPSAPASPPPSNCTALVSPGDLAAGVTALRDDTCATSGGVGCFRSICRYCRTASTTKSANFLPCSNFMYTPATYPATASVTFYWWVFSGQTWTFPVTKSQQCHRSCAPIPWSMTWTGLPTTADPDINGGRSQIVFYQSNDCSDEGQAFYIGDYAFPTVNNMTNIGSVASFMILETGLQATQPMQTETCAPLGG